MNVLDAMEEVDPHPHPPQNMNNYDRSKSDSHAIGIDAAMNNERTSLLRRLQSEGDAYTVQSLRHNIIRHISPTWIPSGRNDARSLRRRIFLLLTEPSSSRGSLIFFTLLIIAITLSNVLMVLQTMEPWQFTPTDCVTCGGDVEYLFEDDDAVGRMNGVVDCVCPPAPKDYTVHTQDWLMYSFAAEWILRVIFFEPHQSEKADTLSMFLWQLTCYLGETSTVLDFWATFPYFLERFGNNAKGLISLRLLRMFRVFQLVRLGQFNNTFISLLNVLSKSILSLRLLALVLIFGAAFFGSMIFWLEKGEWKYWEATGDFRFIRQSTDGTDEISPFHDVPSGFWWFIVTATTVGYGDTYPTSGAGKLVAVFAMLTGVLVIAFPVSVFSNLWQKEVQNEAREQDVDEGVEDMITMSREDINRIRSHMKIAEEHQNAMRDILEKYELDR